MSIYMVTVMIFLRKQLAKLNTGKIVVVTDSKAETFVKDLEKIDMHCEFV